MASTLKHLRSSTADKRPVASGLADGQLAINTASGTPALFFKDSNGGVVKVGPAHVGAAAPNAVPAGSTGNSLGELWVDNSLTTAGLKYYTGSAFVNLTPSGTETTVGLVELATPAETQAGTDAIRAVTPSGLQSKVSDSTSTTSSTTIASSTAVKSAYDLANAALPKAGGTVTGELLIGTTGSLVFEGSADDSFETTIAVTNPTADRTITFPNVTGTVVTTGDTGSITSTMILDGTITGTDVASGTITSTNIADNTIVNADINSAAGIVYSKLALSSGIVNTDISASAAIAGTKISPDFGAQNTTTTGTSTAASFIPTSSGVPTNGLYLPAANTVGISTNGTGRLFVDSSGKVSIVSSQDTFFSGAQFRIGDSSNDVGIQLAQSSANAGAPRLVPTKSRGTLASPAVVIADDQLFTIRPAGYVGSTGGYVQGAQIGVFTDGTPTDASNGLGSYVTISTREVGGTLNERFRITSAGFVGIGTTSPTELLSLSQDVTTEANLLSLTGTSLADGEKIFATFKRGAVNLARVGAEVGGAGTTGQLIFETAISSTSTERARIDSSGRLLVGTSSTSAATTTLLQGNSSSSTGNAALLLATGTSTPSDGGALGNLAFTDSGHGLAATIIGRRDGGTWTSGTSQPTRLVFSTTADGASSPTERLRITSDGTLRLFNSPGIDFSQIQTNAAGMTSETLDGYEEGTWTVQFYDASSGGNVSSTTTTGHYTKIGRQVTAGFAVSNISTAGMTAGNVFYYTLPFTAFSSLSMYGALATDTIDFLAGRTMITAQANANTARGLLSQSGDNVADASTLVSYLTSGTSDLRLSITYFV